jgi:hypothetical protein
MRRRVDTPFSPNHEEHHAPFVRASIARAICEGDRPIQAWRHQHCIGVSKLGKLTGIDPARLMNLERQIEAPTEDELDRLAKALGAPRDMLTAPA